MNFSFFTLSVFDNCDYEQFVAVVNQIKKTGIERQVIEVNNTGPCLDEYFKPKGARERILRYEKQRADEIREELLTEDKHKRP